MDNFKIRDTRRKGFFTVDNEFVDIIKEIGGNATVIYLYLCKCADNITQESFPSQETIMQQLGISLDTIQDKLKILEGFNLIKIEQTKEIGTGKWLHNTYTLLDKTVWGKTPPGNHTGKNTPRSEANTVQENIGTNNTNVLTKPMVTQKLIVNNDLLNEKFLQEQETKRIKKTTPKTRFPASVPQFPQYPQRREGTANGKGIR